MARIFKRIDTNLIHAGEPRPRIAGAVEMPIFQSAMFEYAGGTGYHDMGYIRLNNTPNHTALHAKLAVLEGAEAALITASGMAAIYHHPAHGAKGRRSSAGTKHPLRRHVRFHHAGLREVRHRVRPHRRG